jgi:hypothetical protein
MSADPFDELKVSDEVRKALGGVFQTILNEELQVLKLPNLAAAGDCMEDVMFLVVDRMVQLTEALRAVVDADHVMNHVRLH